MRLWYGCVKFFRARCQGCQDSADGTRQAQIKADAARTYAIGPAGTGEDAVMAGFGAGT